MSRRLLCKVSWVRGLAIKFKLAIYNRRSTCGHVDVSFGAIAQQINKCVTANVKHVDSLCSWSAMDSASIPPRTESEAFECESDTTFVSRNRKGREGDHALSQRRDSAHGVSLQRARYTAEPGYKVTPNCSSWRPSLIFLLVLARRSQLRYLITGIATRRRMNFYFAICTFAKYLRAISR